jgi:hypothetical protein
MMTNRLGSIALAALALAGCTETLDSKNIRTQGISATIEATAGSATSTRVVATLKAGGDESNTYIDLNAGDKLTAESGGKQVLMTAESTGVYNAQFATGEAETEFKVLLERDVDDDAPNNAGKLPAPFDIGALPTEPVSRAEALTITWSPGDTSDTMHIHLDGDCIFFEDIDVPGDPGTYTIDANKLKPTSSDKPESCDVNIEVSRSRKGSVDPTLDPESTFVLKQVRSAKVTSAP